MEDTMTDNLMVGGHLPGWDAPAIDGAPVTTSNTTADPNGPFRGLYVGAAGDVKVTTRGGSTFVLPSVPAGVLLPVAVSFVWTTGTTVASPGTNIVGLK